MNDNQILVVQSRWVYNYIDAIFEAHVSFFFFAFIHSFQKFVSDFGDFQTLMCWKRVRDHHTESTTCIWVCEMNRGIHCKLGSSLRGSQSLQDLASLMRKGRTFLIPGANSCIDCEPHKGWPRFAMNASIHLTHSFACIVLNFSVHLLICMYSAKFLCALTHLHV